MNIDKSADTPLYTQIYNNILHEIKNGYLIPEDKLPSRRALCKELGVAQCTVENAYAKLVSDGLIISHPGSGYYVSSEKSWDEKHSELKSNVFNFSTNGVETSKLPFSQWSKLVKKTVNYNTGLFQHGEKAGEWCLRKSIRRLLFRTEGIQCRTEQIVIGSGAEDLLRDIIILFWSFCDTII